MLLGNIILQLQLIYTANLLLFFFRSFLDLLLRLEPRLSFQIRDILFLTFLLLDLLLFPLKSTEFLTILSIPQPFQNQQIDLTASITMFLFEVVVQFELFVLLIELCVFFLHGGVPVVLDAVVGPAFEVFCDFCPAVAEDSMGEIEHHFFFAIPLKFLDVGVEMVVPSFSALFPHAAWDKDKGTWHVFSDYCPFLRAVTGDQLAQVIVLFDGPAFFAPYVNHGLHLDEDSCWLEQQKEPWEFWLLLSSISIGEFVQNLFQGQIQKWIASNKSPKVTYFLKQMRIFSISFYFFSLPFSPRDVAMSLRKRPLPKNECLTCCLFKCDAFAKAELIFRVNPCYIIQMQEDKPQNQSQRSSFAKFNYHKLIQNWDDFRKTFRSVKFQEAMNRLTEQELMEFWKVELNALGQETERISILVPAKVPKADNAEKQKPNPKNSQKNKGRDQKANNDVPIDQRVLDCAIKLIQECFPQLDYDFSSIFMGNDKQLLIYRRCYALEKYIERYRLPKSFEGPYGELLEITKQFFEQKIERNKAISTFNSNEVQRTNKLVEVIEEKLMDRLQQFKPLFLSILEDYRSKPKCRDLVLNNAPHEIIELLRPICQENKLVLINRYNQCDNDEYKDAIVVKADDPRLIQGEITNEPPPRIEYTYLEPIKLPEAPKDIRDKVFLKFDLAKQCYRYRFDLPHSGNLNPVEGLFIRSAFGSSESYELNVDVQEGKKQVEIDIYPYRYGKLEYQIYIWNKYGITKSTDQIVLFNQMALPNTNGPKLQSYNLYMLGQSESGLLSDGSNHCDQLTKFSYNGKNHLAKEVSLANAAVICDAYGDVAGWGEMYYPAEEKKEKKQSVIVEEIAEPSVKIEAPCLLLGGKQIRKVSCGLGYCLMLSTFGSVFSMGFNQFGQLGQGNFQMGEANMAPSQICKFTNATSAFITDVHASFCGASFATNEHGQLYRWGFNQVEETAIPIYDRFGSVINYTASTIFYKSPNPTRLGKNFIQGRIKQIQSGNGFYFALNNEGILFGWGDCQYLGVSDLKDRQQRVVTDIINPIILMKRIEYISVGLDHCVAITHKNRIIAWGNSLAFSEKISHFAKEPVDITQEYGGREAVKLMKAGHGFTAIVTHHNIIRIIGATKAFKEKEIKADFQVVNLQCSYDQLIGVLGRLSS